MNSSNMTESAGELGAPLHHWRDTRGKSQLDPSIDGGRSQRHLSFIESGRSEFVIPWEY